jgi:periplasmic protein TonB
MAVQILNDMPDAAIHRGDSLSLSDWSPRATSANTSSNRPAFIAITIGLHLVAVLGFLSVRHVIRADEPPAPILASIVEAPPSADELPQWVPPSMTEVQYVLPMPEAVAIEPESIVAQPIVTTAIAQPATQEVVAPMVESVEYVRAPAPQYPRESSRRREFGTVVLRVLVDPAGRPAQIQLERSSGYERLDLAARHAVEKALFRPHEVNGVPQAAQVLIPIEFMRRAS